MKEHLPKDAKILYLEGTPGLLHTQERKKGFEKALGRSDVTTLASLSANYDRAEGMKVTEDWIQSFSKFDAIVAANDQMALGALEALQGADRLKGVMISGVDGTADALNAIKTGTMSQTIFQDAAGQAKADFDVVAGIKKGEVAPAESLVPFASITEDNAATEPPLSSRRFMESPLKCLRSGKVRESHPMLKPSSGLPAPSSCKQMGPRSAGRLTCVERHAEKSIN